MKRQNILLTVVFALIGFLLFNYGCVKEDFDLTPSIVDSSSWEKTVTIAELKTLLTGVPETVEFADLVKNLATTTFWDNLINAGVVDSSIIIEGYVTSNDSAGNFYEVFTIQDQTGGIDIKVNADYLYNNYKLKPGQRVLVRVNELAFGAYHGTFQIGAPYTDAGVIKVTGMEPAQLVKVMQRSGKRNSVVPVDLTIDQITKQHIQKLVRITNVQFWDATKAYSLPGVNTNRTLIDCNGNRLVLRTSGYCKFKNDPVPQGNGSITGVLSYYNDTYQLYIRDLKDVQLTNERCGASPPTPNKTIAQLRAMCNTNLMQINQDVVIQGVVCGNDESGNLYKQLFIQDETGGMEFRVDIAGMYPEFPVGTKIIVNCNGLYLGKYGNVVQLGGLYGTSIGRLSPSIFYTKVFTIETGLEVNPITTTISTINDQLIGKLITITDVRFARSEIGKTWADPTATANRNIQDFLGTNLIVRTSNYANFAGIRLPDKKGRITGILGKYYNDYQLLVRDLQDVRMIEPLEELIINQDFASGTLNTPISIDGWQSIAIAGTKQWLCREYSGNKCAEMNAYQSNEASNIGWLVSPAINLSNSSNLYLAFQTQYNYWASGTKLEAFVLTNYDGSHPETATQTPLSSAYIVAQSDGASKWVSSGLISLSAYTGTIHIGFKYSGGGTIGQTTAYRVDNFKVFTK